MKAVVFTFMFLISLSASAGVDHPPTTVALGVEDGMTVEVTCNRGSLGSFSKIVYLVGTHGHYGTRIRSFQESETGGCQMGKEVLIEKFMCESVSIKKPAFKVICSKKKVVK